MEKPETRINQKALPCLQQVITQLCNKVLSLFVEEKEIQHSLLERLIASIINQFCDHNYELGDSFNHLADAIKIAYQTNDISEEYEKGFETGLLYSMVFGADYLKRKKLEDSELIEAKAYVEGKQGETIIRIIDNHDGISQTELLNIYNKRFPDKEIRKARMSQILSDLKARKIVYDTSIGKNKYYRLTSRGEYIVNQLYGNQTVKIDNSHGFSFINYQTIDLYKEISAKKTIIVKMLHIKFLKL